MFGRGDKVKLGEESWIGCSGPFRLSPPLLGFLHSKGLYKLADASKHMRPGSWFQDWFTADDLNLPRNLAEEWSFYTSQLKHSAIILQDWEDELKWSRNKAHGNLTAKLGYEAMMENLLEPDLSNGKACWWALIWMLESHLKTRLLLWLALPNKVLT
jgi:hypothetical protein